MAGEIITIKEIKKWGISSGNNAVELKVVSDQNNDVTVSFPLDSLLGAIEAFAAGAVSICNKTTGRIPFLAADQTHVSAAGDGVGIGFRFGKHGQIYFELNAEQGQILSDRLIAALNQTDTSVPPRQH